MTLSACRRAFAFSSRMLVGVMVDLGWCSCSIIVSQSVDPEVSRSGPDVTGVGAAASLCIGPGAAASLCIGPGAGRSPGVCGWVPELCPSVTGVLNA